MKNVDIADNIRKNISEEVKYLIEVFNRVDINYVRTIIEKIDEDKNGIINSYNLGNNKVVLRNTRDVFKSQMFTDYYRIEKYKNKLEDGTPFIVRPNKEFINRLYKSEKYFVDFMCAINSFYMCSNFERILINKCLDDSDVEYLKSINPFFELEYERYNKDITIDNIENLILELRNEDKRDIEYYVGAYFIMNLAKINANDAKRLLSELINDGVSIVSFYKNKENCIEMGKYKFSPYDIAFMLKEFCETGGKRLNYKKDDNDGVK